MRAPAQLQGTRDFLLGLGRAIISDRFFTWQENGTLFRLASLGEIYLNATDYKHVFTKLSHMKHFLKTSKHHNFDQCVYNSACINYVVYCISITFCHYITTNTHIYITSFITSSKHILFSIYCKANCII